MWPTRQHYSVVWYALVLAIVSRFSAQAAAQPVERYCNRPYMYCVDLPNAGHVEPHVGDASNHGVTIDLQEQGSQVWTYAHWDAALVGNSQKEALRRVGIILKKHPDAEVSIKPTILATLSAYRIQLSYTDKTSMKEELIVAYRKPTDESKGPGIMYEIGLSCGESTCLENVRAFEALVHGFRLDR